MTGLALALAIGSGLYGGPIASLVGTAGSETFVNVDGSAPLTSALATYNLAGGTLDFGGTMKVLSSPGLFQFVFTDATIACTNGECGNVSLDMMWSVPIDSPIIGDTGDTKVVIQPGPRPKAKVNFGGSVEGDFGNPHWVQITGRAFSGTPSNLPDQKVLSSVAFASFLEGAVNGQGLRNNGTAVQGLSFAEAVTVKSRMTIFNMSEGDTITLPDSLVFSVRYPASTIPEPQTLALVGAAVGLLFWARRHA
ncbi:MAG: hypothetical protein NTV70_00660 [Acidobacteria bacterium]|nr:hypothetical protein [Acidobacteriota bacterium]